ncbi:MAG: putative transposase [Gammaproteobacteria bacterium]|jgi:putative transposase
MVKTEVTRQQGPLTSIEAVEFATLEWVGWYNNQRAD